jgi:hypothetical protein
MNYDAHEDYYRKSRGYNWHDMHELRQQPRRTSTEVPDVFKHMFSDRAAYDAWVDERRKLYFG